MLSKLPSWVWSGAWTLAFVAGFVNVIGLLGFEHQAITHLTGLTSMLASATAVGDSRAITVIAAVLLSFVFGCACSGFIIQDSTLSLDHRYGLVLVIETALFCFAVPLLHHQNPWGMYLTGAACGLQNAMVSAYSGTVIRTTHVSGMFTDLGIFFGHWLRRIPYDSRRLRLCLVIISAFFCGGVLGALAFQRHSYNALYIPASMTGALAIAYAWFSVTKKKIS